MKVATVSTLWDYIHRAMPWNAPKSLSPTRSTRHRLPAQPGRCAARQLRAVDSNIAEVQKRMPNRNGMTLDHGMWPGKPGPLRIGNGGKPDVKAVACMKDCVPEPPCASFLPDFARNAHGNLAEQNRMVGAQHGADTTQAPGPHAAKPAAAPAAP
jgi:hypothetical protein